MIFVSACLLGQNCTYKGSNKLSPPLIEALAGEALLPVCPELFGRLPLPRPPAEICGGDGADVLAGRAQVCDSEGRNVTAQFLAGAHKLLALAEKHRPTAVILKENSPSCGSCFIYDGSFSNRKISGSGVAAALLRQHGFAVFSEESFLQAPKIPDETR